MKILKSHPAFTISNPNRARSLISSFSGNLPHFHALSGEGYRFLADCILEIDPLNPQVAARMVSRYRHWRKCYLHRTFKYLQALYVCMYVWLVAYILTTSEVSICICEYACIYLCMGSVLRILYLYCIYIGWMAISLCLY